ncbi:MAG: WecB/TagA/CpsF family glycosyltransferase [Chthonomonas sp.]|nr:WecB/TagA/CpsF family glycosyltransferase [Chthonomonas sp.]
MSEDATPRALADRITPLCGFNISALSYADSLSLMQDRLRSGKGGWVLTVNLEILSTARLDPDYRRLIQGADVVVADGMPFVWASRLKRGVSPIPERTTGSDLSGDLIRNHPLDRIAIIGGANPPQALRALQIEEHDEMFIFDQKVDMRDEALDALIGKVRDHGADLIFVALGVPKQDVVAAKIREQIPNALILGVGGTFELIAGLKPRAPMWMRMSGLEWLWRLYVEPRRLWRRYLLLYWVGLGFLVDDVLQGPKARALARSAQQRR